MSRSYLSRAATAVATPPQSEPLNSRQVKNNAGGFVFQVDDWKRLDRFLILGSEGGTYYVSEKKLTVDNVKAVARCVELDGLRTVNQIVAVSDAGRAPKNDPALLALAYAASKGDAKTRAAAFNALPKVARIGTHLFHFVEYVRKFRGWGRGLRQAITNWYYFKTPDQFAEQVTKYAQRDGWSHRDLMRLAHPKFTAPAMQNVASYVVKGLDGEVDTGVSIPDVLKGALIMPKLTSPKMVAKTITKFGLVREHIPTQFLTEPEVWEALLEKMPVTAMIRNLGNMSKVGLLKPLSTASKLVAGRLTDQALLRKGRVHPIQLLIAQKTYGSGHGLLGRGEWTAVPQVIDALDDAFYMAFQTIEPTGKNFYIGVDVSRSMGCGAIAGTSLTPREAAAALALVTAKTESNYYIAGFTHALVDLGITPKMRLDDVVRTTSSLSFGATDCALPMLDAAKQKMNVDTFMILTDNETWFGDVHPMQALQVYRNKFNPKAKLVVVGMTATEFSIADPTDAGMLDVVGFDAAAPAVIADFSRN